VIEKENDLADDPPTTSMESKEESPPTDSVSEPLLPTAKRQKISPTSPNSLQQEQLLLVQESRQLVAEQRELTALQKERTAGDSEAPARIADSEAIS